MFHSCLLAIYSYPAVPAQFSKFDVIKFTELSGNNINSLTNVITLETGVHDFFGQLRVWFDRRCVVRFRVTYGPQLAFHNPVVPG